MRKQYALSLALNGSVGRAFLFLTAFFWFAISNATDGVVPLVEIEINNTPMSDDDYFCWTPTQARLRFVNGTEPITLVVSSRSRENGGEVVFQADQGVRPTSSDFAPRTSIELTLANRGIWTSFWIAGSKASSKDKDTEVVVSMAGKNTVLTSIPVMVRVRKDAASLRDDEVIHFLNALRSHHDVDNGRLASKYLKYIRAHESGFRAGIHRSGTSPFPPLFLAWHRAFLLSLERELQQIEPAVALPYWRFDRDDISGNGGQRIIFSSNFMGTVSGGTRSAGGRIVMFSDTNPLNGWRPGDGRPLTRRRDGTTALIPSGGLGRLLEAQDGAGSLIYATYRAIGGGLEQRYHNRVHRQIGGTLIARSSPGDPLFFLLHANVDRAWGSLAARRACGSLRCRTR